MSREQALEEMQRNSGIQFDPDLLKVLIDLFNEGAFGQDGSI
jgi:HD-GYP domain-containing protein (c-di-GMP phosphodiesterase class II)